MTGVRWDEGVLLAPGSDVPQVGIDTFASPNEDWSGDTSPLAQDAIDAVFAAGGGEVVVPNLGRTYYWHEVNLRSHVGLRFVGHPRIVSNSPVSGAARPGRILKLMGSEGDEMSLLTSDHPLPDLTVASASWSAGVTTITTVQPHNLIVGDEVKVVQCVPSTFNGTLNQYAVVSAVNAGAQTFSFVHVTDPGAYVSGGEVEVLPYIVHPSDVSGFAPGDVVMTVSDDVSFTEGSVPHTITALTYDPLTGLVTVIMGSDTIGPALAAVMISGTSSSGPGSFDGTFTLLTNRPATYKLQTDPGTWSGGGTAQTAHGQILELNKIVSISGNSVRLERPISRSYLAASRARLVKMNACEGAYVVGPVSLTVPIGGDGGGIQCHYAYDCVVQDTNVYGAAGRPSYETMRSGKIRYDRWGAYDGQNFHVGTGSGYGLTAGESSHDLRIVNGFSSHIRENVVGGAVLDVVLENNSVLWTWGNGLNTHGAGCKNVRIVDNHVGYTQGVGIVVGAGDDTEAGDENVDVLDNTVYGSGRAGIQVEGHSDRTRDCKSVRVRGNRVRHPKRELGILVKYAEDVEVEGNSIEGLGEDAGQTLIYAHDASDVTVRNNRIRGGGTDYGIRWDHLIGAEISGNSIRDVASHNLWGDSVSTDIVLGVNPMDDSDVELGGQETLLGESLSGATRVTLSDADVTPDPVHRFQVWSPTASRTVHAPTATKRAVGQRITFDITNAGLSAITPIWDSAFKLGAPLVVAAP